MEKHPEKLEETIMLFQAIYILTIIVFSMITEYCSVPPKKSLDVWQNLFRDKATNWGIILGVIAIPLTILTATPYELESISKLPPVDLKHIAIFMEIILFLLVITAARQAKRKWLQTVSNFSRCNKEKKFADCMCCTKEGIHIPYKYIEEIESIHKKDFISLKISGWVGGLLGAIMVTIPFAEVWLVEYLQHGEVKWY